MYIPTLVSITSICLWLTSRHIRYSVLRGVGVRLPGPRVPTPSCLGRLSCIDYFVEVYLGTPYIFRNLYSTSITSSGWKRVSNFWNSASKSWRES